METMQELFYRDPYAREFSATVTSCREGKKGFEVVLDDTVFYPEGGGQPSDEGTLGEAKVIFVKRVGPETVSYTHLSVRIRMLPNPTRKTNSTPSPWAQPISTTSLNVL